MLITRLDCSTFVVVLSAVVLGCGGGDETPSSSASASVAGSGGASASVSVSGSGGAGGSSGSVVGTGGASTSTSVGGIGGGASTGFADEPAGFVTLCEWNDEAALVANGWYDDGNPSGWGSKTRVTSGYAGSPAIGGMAVVETFYAGGVEGGHDAGRMQCNVPAGTQELFFGAELQFKSDYPTSTSSGGNKQLFVTFTGGGRYFVNLDEGLAAGKWGVYEQSSPLADSSIDVAYGSWIKVEWYLKKDTGAGDGIMQLWIDGALGLDLANLTFPAGDMELAYDDGSNNGNHYPLESDPRKIGTDLGGPVDAYRWTAALHVSTPPP